MTATDLRRNGQQPYAPPANVDAEEAVLGCCLRDRDALTWAVDHLQTDQFHRPAHRTVFAALVELHRDRQPVDAKVLAAVLAGRGALPDVGGAPFLLRLWEEAPVPAMVGFLGRKIQACWRLRSLIDAGTRIRQLALEASPEDPDRALATARALLDELEVSEGPRLADTTDILHAVLAARDEEDRGVRLSWGLKDLDRITGGLRPRQLIVVAARPSEGKSSLALQVALQAAKERRSLFGSWEMGLAEIGQHHLAALGGVSIDDALWDVASDRLAPARADYVSRAFLVLDGRPDLERFCGQVRATHDRQPLDLVVVDYLQLVATQTRYDRRDLQVGAISAALKQLAVDCDLPVVLISTLRRSENAPRKEDLRDSGMIEYDADQVLLLAEQEPDSDDERRQREAEEWRVVDAILDKNRMGRSKVRCSLRFDEPRALFQDLSS